MLRIHTSTSVAEAKSYYTSDRQESYYAEGQEFIGYWGGHAAEMLGLEGPVDRKSFGLLCENRHPLTGEQLTPRNNPNRRVLEDFNFACPKSVSLAYFFHNDERIMQVYRQSVQVTMEYAEKMVATRVRGGWHNRDENRPTGNMCWAEVIHLTARPEDGYPDPHIHSHMTVFNLTHDQVEGRWKAAQFGGIREAADELQAIFLSHLSHGLAEIGYEIEQKGKWFDLAGLPRDLLEQFSRRTAKIEAEAAARGITDPELKGQLGAMTREKKNKSLQISELKEIWWQHLKPEHKKALEALPGAPKRTLDDLFQELGCELQAVPPMRSAEALGTRQRIPVVETKPDGEPLSAQLGGAQSIPNRLRVQPKRKASLNEATKPIKGFRRDAEINDHDRKAVALAMEHLFERQSVVTEGQLVTEAIYSWGYGRVTVSGIQKVIAETPFLRKELDGRMLLSTAEVLQEENRIIDRCIHGKGKFPPLNLVWQIENTDLNLQQKEAVFHVLTSRDFITGITGRAGTGKTTLLQEIKRGMERNYHKLFVFAPGAEAARDVLRKEGFRDSETVAKLLFSKSLQEQARGAVWLIDEAGLLSNRQTDKLSALAAENGARLVFVGDTKQHHAVERGQAFDLLQRFGHMRVATVEQIQRQKGAYKWFVEKLLAKDVDGAFNSLEKMEALHELPGIERHQAVAKEFATILEKKKTVLVTSPTHAECDLINQAIRDELKERKILKGEGVQWRILDNLSWTNAQKGEARKYKRGLVVQINGHVKGFAMGEQLEVVEVEEKRVVARSRDGKGKTLPLSHPDTFCVYQRDAIEICEGDQIAITTNSRDANGRQLYNGKSYKVDYFAPDGKIVLDNGCRLDKSFMHLDHGYSETFHASQGKTVDYVLVCAPAHQASIANTANGFYVAVSRGRYGLKVYADNIELLKEQVSRECERLMATELLQGQAEALEVDQKLEVKSATFLGHNSEMKTLREVAKQMAERMQHQHERACATWLGEGTEKGLVSHRTRETAEQVLSEYHAQRAARMAREAEREQEKEQKMVMRL